MSGILKSRGIAERIVDGELVLYDTRRQAVHALNATAAFIWNKCDGTLSEGAIAAALAECYPENGEAIRRDVAEILELFRSQGLLEE